MAHVPRLYLDQDLAPGQDLTLSREAAHRLFAVMRLKEGDEARVFNGRHGEWRAHVASAGKKGGTLRALEQIAPQTAPPDLWLLFAPVKKAQTDFIVEKAVELGVARLCPVQTDFTNAERIRPEKMQARIVEAAEQCGIPYLPELAPMEKLSNVLSAWHVERAILFCDEGARGQPSILPQATGPWAVLIGPEGGFSEAERSTLRGLNAAHAISLGPRILRAETATVAALALWQASLGDWT